MHFWDKNLESLLARNGFKGFIEKLESAPRNPGLLEPILNEDSRAARMLSFWADRLAKKTPHLYLITGFGTGEPIRELLERVDSQSYVLVGEPDVEHLLHVLHTRDCSALLSDERLLIVTGELSTDQFDIMAAIHYLPLDGVVDAIYSPLYSKAQPYFQEFIYKAKEGYGAWGTHYYAALGASSFFQISALRNLDRTLGIPDIAALKDLFADVPCVLVCAGPSLDVSWDFLKEAAQRALIIVVNTAYRAAKSHGTQAQLSVALDPRPDTAKGYMGASTEGTYLVCSMNVAPEALDRFVNRTFTWSGGSGLARYARTLSGLEQGTFLLESGTVALSALDLIRFLGCQKVVLVGQDLAIRPTGQTHTQDSFYKDEGRFNARELVNCLKVPGTTQPTVLTQRKLWLYLNGIQGWIGNNPTLTVRNTSVFGAAIAGAPFVSFSEALEFLGESKIEPQTLKRRIDQAYQRGLPKNLPKDAGQRVLQELSHFAMRLRDAALEAALVGECLPDKLADTCFCENRAFKNAFSYADRVNALIDENEIIYLAVFEGELRSRMAVHHANKVTLKKKYHQASEAWIETIINNDYYWALVDGASDFLLSVPHS